MQTKFYYYQYYGIEETSKYNIGKYRIGKYYEHLATCKKSCQY